LPFARLIKQIHKDELVVATGIGRTPEREDDFFWIAPMTANVIGICSIVDDSINTNAQSTDYQKNITLAELDKLKSVSVITLVKIDSSQSAANQIWVLTHLEPPFSEYDERGKPSGHIVELVQGILSEPGLHPQILVVPWQRILVESNMKSAAAVFKHTIQYEVMVEGWLMKFKQRNMDRMD